LTIHVGPEATRLDTEVARHRAAVEQLSSGLERQAAASRLTSERAWNLHHTASRLAAGLDAHRDQLDGIPASPSLQPAPSRARGPRVPGPTPQHEPPDRPHLASEVQL
jgi:hypothetical protein